MSIFEPESRVCQRTSWTCSVQEIVERLLNPLRGVLDRWGHYDSHEGIRASSLHSGTGSLNSKTPGTHLDNFLERIILSPRASGEQKRDIQDPPQSSHHVIPASSSNAWYRESLCTPGICSPRPSPGRRDECPSDQTQFAPLRALEPDGYGTAGIAQQPKAHVEVEMRLTSKSGRAAATKKISLP